MDEGVQILELARNAQRLFERQEPRQKRRLLNFVLSNCTWEDGEVVATFRQPFDLLAETAAIAARHGAGNTAKSAKSEIWLGDLDSNQDYRSPLICSHVVAGRISMPRVELTKSNIDALKAAAYRYTAWDTEMSGFGLRVTPNGRRVYVLKYRVNGQQRWYTIGRHGSPWTPRQARLEAQRLLGEVAREIDPADKRLGDRKALKFADLCDLYLAEGVSHKKASTLRSDRGRITIHLKPLLGTKRADAITRADIERL
jgi:hypothetical protein